ncbi:MAG: deoxyribose-phosphate aldolase [Bdellovibrionota bacterium]
MQGARTSMIAQPSDLAPFIDHTLLKPEASEADIVKLCDEAIRHRFKAVCVNPIHVRTCVERLSGSSVATACVVGFPLGASLATVKAKETENAVRDGASEIDMVVRIDLARAARWNEVEADIAAVVAAASGAAVKVILETGILSAEQITGACQAAERAGAAFVKTATGFLGRGASVEDIELMKKSTSPRMQIKASGGVKTFEQAKSLIEAGATRIGTSSGVALVTGAAAGAGY